MMIQAGFFNTLIAIVGEKVFLHAYKVFNIKTLGISKKSKKEEILIKAKKRP